jgi:hypothetical protein
MVGPDRSYEMAATTTPTEVLVDPLAVELLGSSIPARLAYNSTDSTPRVIPIAFHFDPASQRIVVCTAPETPKVAALRDRPDVALTIDTEGQPPHVLLVRGTAEVDIVPGIPDEYLAATRKVVPADQWEGFEATVRSTYTEMARITITPTWTKLMDFETRVPEFLQRRMEAQRG